MVDLALRRDAQASLGGKRGMYVYGNAAEGSWRERRELGALSDTNLAPVSRTHSTGYCELGRRVGKVLKRVSRPTYNAT